VAEPRKSVFRVVAETVNAKVTELLTTEKRQIPDFLYGPRKTGENEHDVRIRWIQVQGSIVEDPKVGATKTPTDAAPAVTPLYIRRADAHIWMRHVADEEVEHLLETVIRAAQRSDFQRYFHWGLARYDYPSQVVGEEVQNGTTIIRLIVPVDIQINAEIDGEFVLREVLSDKLNAGIVADLEDDLDPTDKAVAEWAG